MKYPNRMSSCALLLLVFFVSLFPVIESVQCPHNGWFGERDQFKCNCKSGATCDTERFFDDTLCERGWFGPQCQYSDLATEATGNKTLTDGNTSTCISVTSSSSQWLTFDPAFRFTWMRLVGDNAQSLKKLELDFWTPESQSPNHVASLVTLRVNNTVVDVHGQFIERIQKIRFRSGDGPVRLCSVYVSGGRNVALKQPTSQSSGPSYPASRAVDGNTTNDWTKCTLTGSKDWYGTPTWTLTISSPTVVIDRYMIYNQDHMPCLLKYFRLSEIYSGNIIRTHIDTQTVDTRLYDIQYTEAKQVDSVTISVSKSYFPKGVTEQCSGYPWLYLQLCEVEAFGDSVCPPNKWGRQCEKSCYCRNSTEKCYVSTGMCPSGCKAGYHGISCDKECSHRSYGESCRQSCSSKCEKDLNLLPAVCHHESGQCFLGCEDGFVGPRCVDECPKGSYGSNCQSPCSATCLHKKCHHVTGQCEECTAGMTGTFCDNECEEGMYGSGCRRTCSQKCPNNKCHHVTGYCDICPAGFQGQDCENECSPKFYGQSCAQTCSINCKEDLNLLPAVCHHESGQCFLGCKDGFVGPRCVDECDTGTYGQACGKNCSSNCLNSECHHVNGFCKNCEPGLEGTFCEKECPDGRYGSNCQSTCSSLCLGNKCDPVTGQCDGCIDGMKGNLCNTKCDEGTYGSGCAETCSQKCPDNKCHHVTGHCDNCPAGFQGQMCEKECPEGSFGVNCDSSCSSMCLDKKCDHKTGHCKGCPDGIQGDFCDQKCDKGTYGRACTDRCSAICSQYQCHPVNGYCNECPAGFKGQFCEQEIPLCRELMCEEKGSNSWIPTLDNVV